ncbi:MAG TPA: peptide MFS transporter [Blastocatellia bacterium]|nr:peptide MFS transporter [Blastocatellia bacterium]
MALKTVDKDVVAAGGHGMDKHPKGLYVLFATEMWERFSFYSMLALFTLYLQDPNEGFGWTTEQATSLYANYLMFVYASPLLGGWLADKKIGYRKAVMIGGFFFMAGHLLLSFRSLPVVYAALTCLVIGNGLFKPNVSTMVGNLYPEGSHLKDRAYNIFYMGINIGAFIAPIVMEIVKQNYGNHPAFAVAAFGMVISVAILWKWKRDVEDPKRDTLLRQSSDQQSESAAVSVDAPPQGVSHQVADGSKARTTPTTPGGMFAPNAVAPVNPIDTVPEWKRIGALIVVFLIVIVFWMVFHQNGSTLTYWADKNTDWEVSGTISNAINPFWVVTLTFPLVWFWKWLDGKGKEPSTPTKMAFGMTLTGLSFFVLYIAARIGEASVTGSDPYAFKVSPAWIITSYAVVTAGELMLSPMGLSLVSKVAPIRVRGLMMGGWFVATAIGNKLTMIGVYWERWLHSTFFAVLGTMALVMAVVLFFLLKPLKKAMPGV